MGRVALADILDDAEGGDARQAALTVTCGLDHCRYDRSTAMAMSPDELRDHLLSFNGAQETFPFGPHTSVFKVGRKMFALSRLGADSLRVSLKCEPRLAEALRESHAAVIPGYHLNKRHWNTVIIDGSLPEQMVKDMIEDSYDLVVNDLPASERRALGWQTGG